ncbi:MAG: hypothetical protein ACK5U7_08445 [Bacteroidota bacterium]|jgi:hypothetical protein
MLTVDELIEFLKENTGMEMPVYINGTHPKQIRINADVQGFCIETDPEEGHYNPEVDILVWEEDEDE